MPFWGVPLATIFLGFLGFLGHLIAELSKDLVLREAIKCLTKPIKMVARGTPKKAFFDPKIGIPFAWYKARIPVFPRKSTREGASSLFGPGPERPKIVSCSRATPRLHRCKSGLL